MPLKLFYINNNNIKVKVTLNKAVLIKNIISYILTLNNVSLIIIKYK
jgi:hypothetical protein